VLVFLLGFIRYNNILEIYKKLDIIDLFLNTRVKYSKCYTVLYYEIKCIAITSYTLLKFKKNVIKKLSYTNSIKYIIYGIFKVCYLNICIFIIRSYNDSC